MLYQYEREGRQQNIHEKTEGEKFQNKEVCQ